MHGIYEKYISSNSFSLWICYPNILAANFLQFEVFEVQVFERWSPYMIELFWKSLGTYSTFAGPSSHMMQICYSLEKYELP